MYLGRLKELATLGSGLQDQPWPTPDHEQEHRARHQRFGYGKVSKPIEPRLENMI